MARRTDDLNGGQVQSPGFDNPNFADGFDANDLPDGFAIAAAEGQAVGMAEEPAERSGFQYRPSAKTIEKLNAMPKEALAKEFGIHIDDWVTVDRTNGTEKVHKGLINSTKEYGVLEDLAEGRYTRKPLYVRENIGHKRQAPYYALVKFMPASADGKYDWNIETRKVDLKYKLDDKGNRIRDARGAYVYTYDRPEVRRDQIIQIGSGRTPTILTPEQQDQVRLLGVIEGVIQSPNGTNQVWVANEYDPSVLVSFNQNYILEALRRKTDANGVKTGKYWSGGEMHTFTFGEREEKLFSQGHGAYVKNEQGENKFVRYDPLKGRFNVSVTLEMALKKDHEKQRAIKEAANRKKAPAQETSESRGQRL